MTPVVDVVVVVVVADFFPVPLAKKRFQAALNICHRDFRGKRT